jgi:ABC-2 type transport system ATP-binding protein
LGIVIKVSDLKKSFGDFEALKGITFSVEENEIFGLIGPNGAGKTTTLRILGTLLSPSSGIVEVFGYEIVKDANKVREILTYLPEDAGAYQYLSGEEYLKFMAGFYTRDRVALEAMVAAGRDITGLGERLKDRVNSYSRGMKRRLLIARALMIKPKFAVLDEPTSGLDVIQGYHVRGMIRDYAEKMGVTILVSSHNMLEVEYLCHRVALINDGLIIAQGTPEELKTRYNSLNLEQAFMEATQLG